MMVFVIALVVGVAVALQAQLAGLMEQTIGTVGSVFMTYFGGALVITALILPQSRAVFSAWDSLPKYALITGPLGLVIVGGIAFAVPRIGLANVMVAVVAAQLLAGALIDHFGWLGADVKPLDLQKLTGFAVIVVGTWLVVR